MKKYSFLILLLTFIFSSCEQILMEDDLTESKVTLTAPYDNAQFTSTSITFNWEPVEGATQYRLQIASPDFDNPLEIVTDVLVDTNSSTQQLNVGNYQWRVKAVNSSYETPYTEHSLSVISNEDFQNNTVILLSPSDNLVANQTVQTLSWQATLGATGYQLQIYNSANVSILDQNLTTTSYNFTFPNGSYTWRVRASNGELQTMFSSFSLITDTVIPNTPTLSLPANSAILSDTAINFQWNRTAVPGSVEKDSIYIYKNSALNDLELKEEQESPFTTTLDAGIYYWFVKSFDEAGNTSSQSTVFSFTVN